MKLNESQIDGIIHAIVFLILVLGLSGGCLIMVNYKKYYELENKKIELEKLKLTIERK